MLCIGQPRRSPLLAQSVFCSAYLDETNVLALFSEALTADVQAVLADETGSVGADAAVGRSVSYISLSLRCFILYKIPIPCSFTTAKVLMTREVCVRIRGQTTEMKSPELD